MSFGKTNYRVGGTRGGADQFKWDDVKNDKYRENYLGHSMQAPVGRWQKGKDLTWYAKASKTERAEALQSELAMAKQRDEDLMNEALGIAPRKRHEPVGGLDANEMKELLKRGEAERDGMNVERVEGLGAAPVATPGFETGPKRTLAERYKDHLASGKADDTYALPGTISHPATESELKAARKEARKAEKAAKKLRKKEKKERKHEKKAKRRHDESDGQEEVKARHQPNRHREQQETQRHARSRSPVRSPPGGRSRTSRRSASSSPARERRRGRSHSHSRSRSAGERRGPVTSPRRNWSPEDSRHRSRPVGSSCRQRQRRHYRSSSRSRSRSRSPAMKRRRDRSSSRSQSRLRH